MWTKERSGSGGRRLSSWARERRLAMWKRPSLWIAVVLTALVAAACLFIVTEDVPDFETTGEGDRWSFQGLSGNTVTIFVDTKDDGLDPVAFLIAPDGTVLAEGDDEVDCSITPVCGFACPLLEDVPLTVTGRTKSSCGILDFLESRTVWGESTICSLRFNRILSQSVSSRRGWSWMMGQPRFRPPSPRQSHSSANRTWTSRPHEKPRGQTATSPRGFFLCCQRGNRV